MRRLISCLAMCVVALAVSACVQQPKDPGWTVQPYSEPPRPTVSVRLLEPFPTEPNAGSATWFADGQYAVGDYLPPGVYGTTVPDGECYWEIAKDFSGRSDVVVENGVARGGDAPKITLRPSDEVVKSRGCGTWRLVRESGP